MSIGARSRSVIAPSLALLVLLVGCTRAPVTAPAHVPTTGAPTTGAPAVECPVTIPSPVPDAQSWREGLFGWAHSAGNGKLWVGGLGDSGVIGRFPADSPAPDGSIGRKFGWWRAVPGMLTITARRLDAESPPAEAWVPDGYGTEGFQSSGVRFPAPGCWEVSGELDSDPQGTRLTFVTVVVGDAS